MDNFDLIHIKSFAEFEEIIRASHVAYDIDAIKKAYDFIEKVHSSQVRNSGESYIEHLLAVAAYIVRLKLDTASVIAAFLHDIDKSDVTIDEIDKNFGTEVAFIVNGLSQIRDFSRKVSDDKSDIENFKSLIFNAAEDVRIIIIRLCEKLHNLQTIESLDLESQRKSALKGLNIYGPLAEYLGLGLIQRKIEDLSFKILEPENYATITNSLDQLYKGSREDLSDLEEEIIELLKKYNFKPKTIYSRRKGNYSIYKKLKRKSEYKENFVTYENIAKLHDTFAVRIIVDTIEECYMVLGLVHSKWEYFQEEYNDYIAKPKDNGYRSLQTNIKYKNYIVEIQIRTQEMQEYNEFGPASHIAYKIIGSKHVGNSMTWTKDLVKWKQSDLISKDDFKVKAFSNSIFVFTPKGLVILLPKNASPIDFAFRIHTSIGYHYAGALVNNKMVSMDHELQTGDVVEVLTNKNITANQGWMKYAKSNGAKMRIRRIMKNEKESVYGVEL